MEINRVSAKEIADRNHLKEEMSTPVQPQASKSSFVVLSFIFMVAATLLGIFGAATLLPYFIVMSGVLGLAAINLAVLSLRERD